MAEKELPDVIPFKRIALLFELAEVGADMRTSQTKFFKDRERKDLEESKRLEARFDKLLDQLWEGGKPPKKQQTIF